VSATETDVRIELEAQYKTVTVKKEQLKGHEGTAVASSSAAPLRAAAPWATRTPMHPSQTPMHPSQTPMHPSQTPMHPGDSLLPCLCSISLWSKLQWFQVFGINSSIHYVACFVYTTQRKVVLIHQPTQSVVKSLGCRRHGLS